MTSRVQRLGCIVDPGSPPVRFIFEASECTYPMRRAASVLHPCINSLVQYGHTGACITGTRTRSFSAARCRTHVRNAPIVRRVCVLCCRKYCAVLLTCTPFFWHWCCMRCHLDLGAELAMETMELTNVHRHSNDMPWAQCA